MSGQLVRVALAGATALLALLSGCKSPGGYLTPDYGMPMPPQHPTVVLTDFSYSPVSPIRVGDTLTVKAITSEPIMRAAILVHLPAKVDGDLELRDDGQPPDETAQDSTWTAEIIWTEEMGVVQDGVTWAMLAFQDFYDSQMLMGSLTVLSSEDDAL